MVMQPELIGRLLLGLFTFSDGHIFYSNNVMKLRYDLINSNKSMQCTDKEIFDIYTDVFELDDNVKVKLGTPLNSYASHRFAYIFSDKNQKQANTIYILPHLEERRIYLNRIKKNTEYFYTSVETKASEIATFNNVKMLKQPT